MSSPKIVKISSIRTHCKKIKTRTTQKTIAQPNKMIMIVKAKSKAEAKAKEKVMTAMKTHFIRQQA